MSNPKADVVVEITFNLNNPERTIIRTNAKNEAVKEILEAWLFGQIGQGGDKREPNKKDEYKIVIRLDLSDDTFYTTSDTGNKGLTCGLVMNVFSKLSQATITDFTKAV